MKRLLHLGLFVLLSANVFAQTKVNFVEYDLPNGLHVILHEEKSTPIVAISILYHVGSKNERVGRTGFAHFFEHLLFEGSTNIKRGEYDKLVEGNGGVLNANTSNDRTFYYEILPSNQLELGMWLESERLLHAKVEDIGIETQRSVVKEEKRQRVDNKPYASFITEAFKRMFVNHPYNWVPIGSMADLDAAQEEDYINFYRTFYVPSNATLSIAGDLDIKQTKAWVAKYFGSIPKGQAINLIRDYENLSAEEFKAKHGSDRSILNGLETGKPKTRKGRKMLKKEAKKPTLVSRPNNYEGKLTSVVRDTVYDNIQLPGLFMVYNFPNQTHEDFYALEMMNEILSGGSSSRLNKSIVEKKEMAVASFSVPFGMEAGGVGIFGAISADGVDLVELQDAMDVEISKMQSEMVTQEEFEKIRNKMENDLITMNSKVAGIAENLADNHVYYGSASRTNTMLDGYLKVTKEDIQRVAKKYLTKNARLELIYLPKEK